MLILATSKATQYQKKHECGGSIIAMKLLRRRLLLLPRQWATTQPLQEHQLKR
jgi:hypothetical protein